MLLYKTDSLTSFSFPFSLTAPGIPRSFTATVNGPRSISLAWMEPAQRNGIIQHYILTTRSAINFTNITMGTSLNLDALEPFTEYMFEVVAVTGAGSGMAAMTNATTDQDGTYYY